MADPDLPPSDDGWREALLKCARFTLHHLVPMFDHCLECCDEQTGVAQVCNQARNVLAHLDWAWRNPNAGVTAHGVPPPPEL